PPLCAVHGSCASRPPAGRIAGCPHGRACPSASAWTRSRRWARRPEGEMRSNAPRAHARPYANVLETIGWTPLIRLNRVTGSTRTPVYAKAEFFNPGGSVKDRIGLAMIEAAEREGRLKPGGVIVEGTSGNTGVGLAIAAAIRGYRCIFTMPDKMSQEKVRLLKAFGAEVVVTPTAVPPDHPDNYVQTAKRIVQETPGAILADQFYNPVNPEAHYRTTGPENWEQTEEIGRPSCRERRDLGVVARSVRRRPTRFSRDWSSDVCSSDLRRGGRRHADRSSAGSPRQLRADREAHRPGNAGCNSRRPVLQPGEPRGPLPYDRPGDLGADR